MMAAVWAFAPLQLPADIQTLMPWCKNMPDCSAQSPMILLQLLIIKTFRWRKQAMIESQSWLTL
jgi:hypothetical protein